MKKHTLSLFSLFAGVAMLGLASCKVEKTQDGNLPDVDVEVEGETRLPEYDVDGPEVETGTKKVEVEVPTVDIIPADEQPENQTND